MAGRVRIMLVGGGSGGHITPLLAVAHELKKARPKAELVYVGQRGDGLGDIPSQDANIDKSYFVRAGKFRRYHGEGIRQIFDLPTLLKNIRDAWFVIVGICQSYKLLRNLRPDVILMKGGFVGVPVGLAAAWLKIPYITHDSDAIPGLANRIIARWAKMHAVALPKEIYRYPQDKTVAVGVPISHKFRPLTTTETRTVRGKLGLSKFKHIVFMTGGGLGARRLNNAVAACVPKLLQKYPDLAVVQLAGRKLEAELRVTYDTLLSKADRGHVFVEGFITNLHEYSGAADVVITRAGGTSIAEFAMQAKPCVVVPNPILAGGHQLKNAKVLEERHAVKVVSNAVLEENAEALLLPLFELLDHPAEAQTLGENFAKIAQPDAAHRLAVLLLEQVKD